MYSIREVSKRTKLHREYIRALCDLGLVDYIRGENGNKRLKYQITDQGILDICMMQMDMETEKRGGFTPPP